MVEPLVVKRMSEAGEFGLLAYVGVELFAVGSDVNFGGGASP
jgi:hypothetical protein